MNKRLVILFVFLIIFIVLIVLASTVFVVTDINVNSDMGDSWYVASDIIDISDIEEKKSIFAINENEITENIQETYPNIRVVSIERKFPNKVVLHITLRVPIISVAIEGESDYLITDWECSIIDVVSSTSQLYINSTKIVGIEAESQLVNPNQSSNGDTNSLFDSISAIAAAAATFGLADDYFCTFFEDITVVDSNYLYAQTNAGVTFVFISGIDTTISEQFNPVYTLFSSLELNNARRMGGYYYFNFELSAWDWSIEVPTTS